MLNRITLPDEAFLKNCDSMYGTMIIKMPKLGRYTVEAMYEIPLAMLLRLAKPFWQKERVGTKKKVTAAGKVICMKCRGSLTDEYQYCPKCGRRINDKTMTDAIFWATVVKLNADVIAHMLKTDEDTEEEKQSIKERTIPNDFDDIETGFDNQDSEEDDKIDDESALEMVDDLDNRKEPKPRPKTKRKGGHAANGRT